MPRFAVELTDGRTFEVESDKQPSESDVLSALGQAGHLPSIGELRRREGQGEIAANPPGPADVPPSLGQRIGEAFAGMDPTGAGLGTPSITPYGTPERAAETQGARQAMVDAGPYLATAIAPEIPVGGVLARSALQGLSSGVAGEIARQVPEILANGKPVGQAALDAALPVLGSTVAGPMIGAGAKLVGAAYQGAKDVAEELVSAYRATKSVPESISAAAGTTPFRTAVADLMRPIRMSPEQLLALRARDTIETATGQRIPLGIADVLGTKEVTRNLAEKSGELLPETLSSIEQLVMHTAANTSKSARTVEDVSKEVYGILDAQKQGLGQPAQDAIDSFSRKAVAAVNNAEGQISGTAKSVFSGRPFVELGQGIRDLAGKAFQSAQKEWNAAYETVRLFPEWKTTPVDLTGVKQTANRAGLNFVEDAGGNLSVLGAPTGVTRELQNAGNLADTGSLEQAKNLVTSLSNNLNNPNYLPGVDVRVKLDMIEQAKNAIDSAIAPFPALDATVKAAKQVFAENIGRFKGALNKGILSDFGEAGGFTPESIIRKLTGPDAATHFDELMKLTGQGATAGANVSGDAAKLVQEAVLSKAASAGTDAAGKVNIGQMLGVVQDLAKPVRDQLFPNMKAVEDALNREVALKTGRKSLSSVQQFLEQVHLDPKDIQTAFQGDTAPLIEQAKTAINAEATAQKELNRLGLDQLADRSAFDIKKWMSDPSNTDRVKNTLEQLSQRRPDLVSDAKALFMENLLDDASPGGVFSPQRFLDLTKKQSFPVTGRLGAGEAGPSAQVVAEGKYGSVLDTVFGSKGRQDLIDLATTMKGVASRSNLSTPQGKGVLETVLFGYSGGPLSSANPTALMNAVGRLTSASPQIKYRIAAQFLSNQNLRRKAMEPISDASLGAIETAVRAAAGGIGQEFGKRSPLYQEVQDIDASIQPGSQKYQAPLR